MQTVKSESTNLVALVAMLLSAAVFKSELSRMKLVNTDVSVLSILVFAICIFSFILYVQLLQESYLSLRILLAESKKSLINICIKGAYFIALLALLLGPLTIIMINSATCYTIDTRQPDPFSPFSTYNPDGEIKRVCQNLLVGFTPFVGAAAAVGFTVLMAVRVERQYRSFDESYERVKDLKQKLHVD